MKTVIASAVTSLAVLLAAPGPASADHHQPNIVETAQAAGDFGTLLAAAEAAGLVHTLAEGGPFTVFAPTDAAFAALPEGTVDSLLLPENRDDLAAILTYHVVPAEIFAADIGTQSLSVLTVNGERLSVVGSGGGVTVDDANVVAADIDASNGVIHVIDSVLLP